MPREKKRTQAQITAYANAYNKEHKDVIKANADKKDHLPERIAQAVQAGKAQSKQAYIIDAIKNRLESDGL